MDSARCAYCGDVVGVYEPLRLLLPDGTHRRGSIVTLADQLEMPHSEVAHERCHELHEPLCSDANA